MYAPPCSWRTGTNWIDESARDSLRSRVSSPGIPNTYLTPSASRHSTNTSEALRSPISPPCIPESAARPSATRGTGTCLAQWMRAVAVGLTALSALVLAGPAAAATTLYIQGGGYGHGIGMSQYGAYGYALHGWTYQQILGHYYTGTQLGTTNPNQTVRVLLSSGPAAFAGATQIGNKKINPS